MNVPIIGQPQVDDWFLALQIKCPCGAMFQLYGQPGAMRACKGKDGRGSECNRVYKISGLPVLGADNVPGVAPAIINQDGSLNFGLAVGTVSNQ